MLPAGGGCGLVAGRPGPDDSSKPKPLRGRRQVEASKEFFMHAAASHKIKRARSASGSLGNMALSFPIVCMAKMVDRTAARSAKPTTEAGVTAPVPAAVANSSTRVGAYGSKQHPSRGYEPPAAGAAIFWSGVA